MSIEQNKQEFISLVCRNILSAMLVNSDDRDRSMVNLIAEDAWGVGMTSQDALLYAKTFEEVTPELERRLPLSRRENLLTQYKGQSRV